MTFYVDLDTLKLIKCPGWFNTPTDITFRRNDKLSLVVKFVSDDSVVDPGTTVVNALNFSLKTASDFDETPALVAAGPFAKTGTGTSTQYAAIADFGSSAVGDAFLAASNAASLDGMFEFTWTNADSSLTGTISRVSCTIDNSVYSGSGGVPAPASPTQRSAIWLPTVTALTGGGSTALDGVVTASVTVPQIYTINISLSSQTWVLIAGTDAEDAAGGIVRGDDYNGSTNAKVFKRIG